mmetsp:Transcript_14831/g.22813  ORF Transcript_14831/g.22813 Transcript_14831/m.22813 type:complete len:272 (-) Transcript_14831:12-827(-)
MSRSYSAEERADRRRRSSKLSSIHTNISRYNRSSGKSSLFIGSSLSNISEGQGTKIKRFSNEDESYSIDPTTGLQVMNSIEEMQRRRWEKELEDDSLKFDPDGTSEEQRQKNHDWAINLCKEHVGQEQQKVIERQNGSANSIEDAEETYAKCDPPPTQPLPPLDQLNLDQNPTTNPRELGFLPPSLPHSFLDIVPKWSRDRVGGISNGELVYGTYEEGIESCDPNTRIVYCVNSRENNCGCLLRCNKSASLVRCPKCNTVSPAGPELLGDK